MLEPNRVHPDFNRKSPAFVRRSMREIRRIARMFVANTNPVEPSILECAETSSCASTSIPSPEPETLFRNSSSSLSLLSNSDVSLHVMSSRHNSKEITDKFVTNDWNPNLGSRASLSDEDEDDEVLRVWYCSVSPKPSSPFQDDNDVGDMVRVFWTRSYCDISEPIRLDTVSKTIEVNPLLIFYHLIPSLVI